MCQARTSLLRVIGSPGDQKPGARGPYRWVGHSIAMAYILCGEGRCRIREPKEIQTLLLRHRRCTLSQATVKGGKEKGLEEWCPAVGIKLSLVVPRLTILA